MLLSVGPAITDVGSQMIQRSLEEPSSGWVPDPAEGEKLQCRWRSVDLEGQRTESTAIALLGFGEEQPPTLLLPTREVEELDHVAMRLTDEAIEGLPAFLWPEPEIDTPTPVPWTASAEPEERDPDPSWPLAGREELHAIHIPRPLGIRWPDPGRASMVARPKVDIGGMLPAVRDRRYRSYLELLQRIRALVVEIDRLQQVVAQLAISDLDPQDGRTNRRTLELRRLAATEDLLTKRLEVEELEAEATQLEQRYPRLMDLDRDPQSDGGLPAE